MALNRIVCNHNPQIFADTQAKPVSRPVQIRDGA